MGCYIYTGIETAPAAFWGKNYLDLVWGKAVVTNTVITVVAYCCSLQIHIRVSQANRRSTNPKRFRPNQIDQSQNRTGQVGSNRSQIVLANQVKSTPNRTGWSGQPISNRTGQSDHLLPNRTNQVKSIPNRTGQSGQINTKPYRQIRLVNPKPYRPTRSLNPKPHRPTRSINTKPYQPIRCINPKPYPTWCSSGS